MSGYPDWSSQAQVERWIKEAYPDPVKCAVAMAAYHGGMRDPSAILSSRFGDSVARWIQQCLESGDDLAALSALVVAGAWTEVCK